MTDRKKLINNLILRGCGAAVMGGALVAVMIMVLSAYGAGQEAPVQLTVAKASTLKFPENEKMLNELAAKLEREGAAMIEPAAGNIPAQQSPAK